MITIYKKLKQTVLLVMQKLNTHTVIYSFIYSIRSLSYDKSTASSKASSQQNAI